MSWFIGEKQKADYVGDLSQNAQDRMVGRAQKADERRARADERRESAHAAYEHGIAEISRIIQLAKEKAKQAIEVGVEVTGEVLALPETAGAWLEEIKNKVDGFVAEKRIEVANFNDNASSWLEKRAKGIVGFFENKVLSVRSDLAKKRAEAEKRKIQAAADDIVYHQRAIAEARAKKKEASNEAKGLDKTARELAKDAKSRVGNGRALGGFIQRLADLVR